MTADMARAQPGELADPEYTPDGRAFRTPAKDWVVSLVARCPDGWRVYGENLNFAPTHRDRRFSWHIPEDPRKEPRYDLSAATWTDRRGAQK